MSPIQRLKEKIFGYDIFISYSRKDSLDYAYQLAKYFMDRGFECYLDQLSSTTPGDKLPKGISDAVDRSKAFVLIGSPGAERSIPIEQEIMGFLTENKNQPLIPINIEGACFQAIWFNKIQGLALIDDTLENLQKGQPAPDVTSRILDALQFTKKSQRLRRIAIGTFCAILIITGVLSTIAIVQAKKVVEANIQLDTVSRERDKADHDRIKSEKKARISELLAKNAQSERTREEGKKNSAIAEWQLARTEAAANRIAAINAQSARIKEEQLKVKAQKESEIAQKKANTNLKIAEYRAKSANEFLKFVEDGVASMLTRTQFFKLGLNGLTKANPLSVYMQMDKASLTTKSKLLLDSLTDYAKKQPGQKIVVEAHTSKFAWFLDPEDQQDDNPNSLSTRTTAYSVNVSQQMGTSVADYLIERGIPAQDIQVRGFGKTINKYNLDMMNNRVEIYLSEK